jgi:hypothetical protein
MTNSQLGLPGWGSQDEAIRAVSRIALMQPYFLPMRDISSCCRQPIISLCNGDGFLAGPGFGFPRVLMSA